MSERARTALKAYYAVDGLGSVVAVVDSAGTRVERGTYDARGKTDLAGTFGIRAVEGRVCIADVAA